MQQIFGSIIPAPNPSGELHLGHVLNLSIQDVLCRWHALKGARIYWLGCIDHGTTSTEFVVDRRLREDGIDPSEWTRKEWDTAVNAWIDLLIPKVYSQLRMMNLIVDNDEVRSMRDPKMRSDCQKLVDQLSQAGLMYLARSVVRWCPRKRTFVDKGEITLEQMPMTEYCVRYVCDWGEHEPFDLWIERPETLVNDAGLAVSSRHPLAAFPNRYVTSPIGLRIPVVVSDEFFEDRSLQSIARITPGHCMKSFRWASKNQSPITRAYDEDNMMEVAPYQGRTRSIAAHDIVDAMAAGGRLIGKRDREAIQEIFRLSGGPVEEFLTEQCFLDISRMAASALDLLRTRQVRIYPNHCHNALEWHFAEIVAAKRAGANDELSDDWCISQQTAWGNDLNVSNIAYRSDSGGRDTMMRRRVEHILTLKMADALFSFYVNRVYSQDADRLREISESSVCVTGFDLLLYWIEPMLLLSTALKEGLPFRDVVIHPLICDVNGEKMSKSLGNTIAPDDMWEKYGSDALRFSLLSCLDLNSGTMSFDEARVLEAKTLLDKMAQSIRTMQQSEAPMDVSMDADRLFVQQFFESIDRALAEYDFTEAMKQVNRIVQRILEGSGDVQQSRRLLALSSLLEPFAPGLVHDAGLACYSLQSVAQPQHTT